MVAAGLLRVYPEVWLFRSNLTTAGPGLALVAFRDGAPDWAGLDARCRAWREQGRVLDPLLRHAEGVGMLYLGARRADPEGGGGPVNTLNNARLELEAVHGRVLTGAARQFLFGDRWMAFERRLAEARAADPDRPDGPPAEAVAAGLKVVSWDFLARAGDPRAGELREKVVAAIPPAILGDGEADGWSWAGPAGLFHTPAPGLH